MNETVGASLGEIRTLLKNLPAPDEAAAAAAAAREKALTKPEGSLGLLEGLCEWFVSWQGRNPPRLERPRVAVFAGNHGVTRHGISAYPPEVTAQMVANFQAGGAAVNQLCQLYDAELRIYEMALDHPTADFTEAAALSEEECASAMAYGMMAVEDGIDAVCLGEMGIGNTTSAAALCCALFGGEARDWTGPGTGVADSALTRKVEAVAAGLDCHREHLDDPFEVLRRLGGHELAAITGAVIAARIGRVPVILDGYAATAAAAVLHKIDSTALDHCIVGHLSAEPAHGRLLECLGKAPLLDLNMRLGEASGAVMALGVLRGAIACHTGMAKFEEAQVSEKL
jgi:nicotinate-nucleotide--dimethylbenzimidazole phosphoribosyltransferase